MLIPGKKKKADTAKWPGVRSAVPASDALQSAELQAGSSVLSTLRVKADGRAVGDLAPAAAAGKLIGQSSAGMRSTGFLKGTELAQVQSAVSQSAGNHVPFTIHHVCTPSGGHDAFFAMRDSGCFLLFATNLQEVVDFGLIAHRIAEHSLLPGICSNDVFGESNEVMTARLVESGLAADFLGSPDDTLTSPTPSQRILFGDTRRRVPRFLDVDRPIGMGARLDRTAGSRALAGQGVYFFDHVPSIADEAFDEFARLTGRRYQPVSGYRTDDAQYVVVAMGAVCESLRWVVDQERAQGRKVGLVVIHMFRPFPGAELCKLLKGKKRVTVLESVHRAFAQNPPIAAEIRASLDRANENGLYDEGTLPHPEYPRFAVPSDRPELYSGITTSSDNVGVDDLVALVANMLPAAANVRAFHVGVHFESPETRLPTLERLSQLLESAYSGIGRLGLAGPRTKSRNARSGAALSMHASADQNLDMIAAALSTVIFDVHGWSVGCRSIQAVGEHRFEPSGWQVRHSFGDEQPPPPGTLSELVAVTELHALADDQVLASLQQDGVLIVAAPAGAHEIWKTLPQRTTRSIHDKHLLIKHVDVAAIATSLSTDRWIQRQLAAHALAGAAVASYPPLSQTEPGALVTAYGVSLKRQLPVGDHLLDPFLQAFEQGLKTVSVIEIEPAADAGIAATELPAPWTVREVPVHTESVYDAGRFWNTVGHLYETGQTDKALSDPYIATGLVPARTASFRSWEPYRTEIPTFLPENCTACGACFAACPDAALPATVTDVASLVETAMKEAEALSSPLLQLQRVKKHLVNQAHKLVTGDARHEYRTAGDLLTAAFEQLVSRLGQTESETETLRAEMTALVARLKTFPIARTDTFFVAPESADKGSGLLFSINVNADSCKSCGICHAVCQDFAIEITKQTPHQLRQYRRDWLFASRLGSVARETIDRFALRDTPESLAYRLLDRDSYHSMLGGDSSFPGSGTQSTLHLMAAVADSVIRPRVESFVATLSECADALEQKIKARVRESVDVNDFEAFGQRLKSLANKTLEPETLAGIASGDVTVDRDRLQQLNDSLLGLRDILGAYDGSATGSTRTNLLGVFSEDHSATNRGYYPYNPFSFPWINTGADTVAVADGLFTSVTAVVISGIRALRLARLILDDVYEPAEHDDALDHLDWRDLTEEEWAICPPVCVIAGDAGEAIPYLLRVEAPVKVFLLSSDVSLSSTGSDVRLWPMARPDLYVLRSTIGVRGHLLDGLVEGLERRGPSLFHLYVAEPAEHGFDPAQSMNRMRTAVESRTFPLMKYNPDAPGEWAHRWDLTGNPAPDQNWMLSNGKERPTAQAPLTVANWAIGEGRYRPYFRHVAKNVWNEKMVSLSEFLELPVAERAEAEPYIEVTVSPERTARVLVMPEIIRLTEKRLAEWQLLQELAGVRSSVVTKISEEAEARFQEELTRVKEQLQNKFASETETSRAQFGADFHSRLTEELMTLSGFGSDTAAAAQRLSDYLSSLSEAGSANDDSDGSSTQSNGAK